jgi:heme exporter protein A
MEPTRVETGSFVGRDVGCARGGRVLFAGVDFVLPPGGALVLQGRNGAGKSSLLRLMAGLGRPVAGRFLWDGVDIAADPEAHRARLQFVGHQDALKPALTVAETLRFWAALAGHAEIDAAAALAPLGLAPLADLSCRFLSAGQRRRLALSRLAAWWAPLWLLDEPATGLDVESLAALAQVIAVHRAAGGAVVLSTHQPLDLAHAQTLALGDYLPPPLAREAALAALDW